MAVIFIYTLFACTLIVKAAKALNKAAKTVEILGEVLGKGKTLALKVVEKIPKIHVEEVYVGGLRTAEGVEVGGFRYFAVKVGEKEGGKVAEGGKLLPGEGKVGTYKELLKSRRKGDNITPHHMPSADYMKNHGVAKNDGVCMNMEQPTPGVGGRHRQTRSYGSGGNPNETPRDALARDIRDARKIYQKGGAYTPQ